MVNGRRAGLENEETMGTFRFLRAALGAAALTAGALLTAATAAEDIPDPFAQLRAQGAAGGEAGTADIPIVIPEPPDFEAQSWVLMDHATGQVLFEHNAHERIWPASLTKMMTSYVLGMEFKAGRVREDDEVLITEDAWSKRYGDSSKMFIEVGKRIRLGDLNRGIIIQSGNDACVAVAIHLAGSEEGFVSVMNSYGRRLGLNDTHFSNVHGLYDEQNYSSAYDMALLGRALIRDLPEEYAIYREKEFVFNNIRQLNRNRLLWDETLGVDGIKTGHLSQVGYNLAASADNGSMRLIAVVIGAKSEKERAAHCRQMLTYGFRFFEHYQPFEAGKPILRREVRMGTENHVDLVVSSFGSGVVIPRGAQRDISVRYRLRSSRFIAPIAKDEQLGILTYHLKDRIIASYPLVAAEGVDEGGFLIKGWDRAVMFFGSEEDSAESTLEQPGGSSAGTPDGAAGAAGGGAA